MSPWAVPCPPCLGWGEGGLRGCYCCSPGRLTLAATIATAATMAITAAMDVLAPAEGWVVGGVTWAQKGLQGVGDPLHLLHLAVLHLAKVEDLPI